MPEGVQETREPMFQMKVGRVGTTLNVFVKSKEISDFVKQSVNARSTTITLCGQRKKVFELSDPLRGFFQDEGVSCQPASDLLRSRPLSVAFLLCEELATGVTMVIPGPHSVDSIRNFVDTTKKVVEKLYSQFVRPVDMRLEITVAECR